MSDATNDSDEITIANEYSHVVVRKVITGKGERLEIRSEGTGETITLDALLLESLAWQEDTGFLSPLLETPFGPEDPE